MNLGDFYLILGLVPIIIVAFMGLIQHKKTFNVLIGSICFYIVFFIVLIIDNERSYDVVDVTCTSKMKLEKVLKKSFKYGDEFSINNEEYKKYHRVHNKNNDSDLCESYLVSVNIKYISLNGIYVKRETKITPNSMLLKTI